MNESSSAVPSQQANDHVNLSQDALLQVSNGNYERARPDDVLLELGIESKDIGDATVRLNTLRSKEATITWENMDVRYFAERGMFAQMGAMFTCNKNPADFKRIIRNGKFSSSGWKNVQALMLIKHVCFKWMESPNLAKYSPSLVSLESIANLRLILLIHWSMM